MSWKVCDCIPTNWPRQKVSTSLYNWQAPKLQDLWLSTCIVPKISLNLEIEESKKQLNCKFMTKKTDVAEPRAVSLQVVDLLP